MHKKRLLKLADLVEQSAEVEGFRFDMCEWGLLDDGRVEPAIGCGTSACMMGTAAISGAFKDDGLIFTITPMDEDDVKAGYVKAFIDINAEGAPGEGAIAAAVHLFEISEDEAHFLFLPSTYPRGVALRGEIGARYAANRVRKFVEHGGIF